MFLIQLVVTIVTAGLGLFLFNAATLHHWPQAVKLALELPAIFVLSQAVILVYFPINAGAGEAMPFWVPKSSGLGYTLNMEHPAARRIVLFWALLGVGWLAVLDDAARHDFTRWWQQARVLWQGGAH